MSLPSEQYTNGYDLRVTWDGHQPRLRDVKIGTAASKTVELAIGAGLRALDTDDPAIRSRVVTPAREFVMGTRRLTRHELEGTRYPIPRTVGTLIMKGLTIMEGGEPHADAEGTLRNNFSQDEQQAAARTLQSLEQQAVNLTVDAIEQADRAHQRNQERSQ